MGWSLGHPAQPPIFGRLCLPVPPSRNSSLELTCGYHKHILTLEAPQSFSSFQKSIAFQWTNGFSKRRGQGSITQGPSQATGTKASKKSLAGGTPPRPGVSPGGSQTGRDETLQAAPFLSTTVLGGAHQSCRTGLAQLTGRLTGAPNALPVCAQQLPSTKQMGTNSVFSDPSRP